MPRNRPYLVGSLHVVVTDTEWGVSWWPTPWTMTWRLWLGVRPDWLPRRRWPIYLGVDHGR